MGKLYRLGIYLTKADREYERHGAETGRDQRHRRQSQPLKTRCRARNKIRETETCTAASEGFSLRGSAQKSSLEVHPQQWEAPQGRPSGYQAPAEREGRCRIQAKAGSLISSQTASRMSAVRVGTVINAIN